MLIVWFCQRLSFIIEQEVRQTDFLLWPAMTKPDASRQTQLYCRLWTRNFDFRDQHNIFNGRIASEFILYCFEEGIKSKRFVRSKEWEFIDVSLAVFPHLFMCWSLTHWYRKRKKSMNISNIAGDPEYRNGVDVCMLFWRENGAKCLTLDSNISKNNCTIFLWMRNHIKVKSYSYQWYQELNFHFNRVAGYIIKNPIYKKESNVVQNFEFEIKAVL